MLKTHASFIVVLLVATGPLALGAEEVLQVPEGFEARVLYELDPTREPYEARFGALACSPTGSPVVYEGGEIRMAWDGGAKVLATFDPPVYGGFLASSPSGDALLFGESSNGDIFSVPLDGSGATLLGNIPFNYDASFAPAGTPAGLGGAAFISAPGTAGNSIYLFDPLGTPPVDEIVANIPGFSGPLTFDAEGNLYYVTATLEAEQTLARFTPLQLAEGIGDGAVEFSDGEALLADLEGAYGLRAFGARLFLTNSGFASGTATIETVDLADNFRREVWATLPLGDGTARPMTIDVFAGSEPFDAGVGRSGGKLLVAYSDFATLTHVAEVTPDLSVPEGGFLALPEGFVPELLFEFDPTAPFATQLGGVGYSAAGEPVVYENGEVRVRRDGGTEVLARFDPPVFGSYLVPSPGGDTVVFGESSTGSIYSIALDGSGATRIGNVPFNYDLAFPPDAAPETIRGRAFVSAPGVTGNSIYVLGPSEDVPAKEVVANIPGYSGPLTFDDEGHLYYVTTTFEPTNTLARFTAAQLEVAVEGGAVDFAEGEVLLDDLEGAYGLRWNRGQLFLTNLGYGSGTGAIEIVDLESASPRSVFATIPIRDTTGRPSWIALFSGEERFSELLGDAGGRLLVAYSDYHDVTHVVEVTPELYFLRGDVNGDGVADLSDAIFHLNHQFVGGPPPRIPQSADVNGDEQVDIADPVYLLNFLFRGGPQVPPPYPERGPSPE